MLRDTPMSVDEAQTYVNSGGPYKLQDHNTLPKETPTLYDFLKMFFTKWNYELSVVYVSNGSPQCGRQASRTVVDMARLCKYYFPESNVITVRQIMFDLVEEKIIGTSICTGINQRVFHKGNYCALRDSRDEFGWFFTKRQKREPGKVVVKKAVDKAPTKTTARAPKRTTTSRIKQ